MKQITKRKRVPKTWKFAFELLQMSSVNHFKQLGMISAIAGCSKTVPRAFLALGYIQKDTLGYFRIVPGISPNWSKVRAWVDSQYSKPLTPKVAPLLFDLPEKITVAPTLRHDCAERTYTKAQVIEAFKAFYVREYDKMDDRAYTLTGFLLTALDEVL